MDEPAFVMAASSFPESDEERLWDEACGVDEEDGVDGRVVMAEGD